MREKEKERLDTIFDISLRTKIFASEARSITRVYAQYYYNFIVLSSCHLDKQKSRIFILLTKMLGEIRDAERGGELIERIF